MFANQIARSMKQKSQVSSDALSANLAAETQNIATTMQQIQQMQQLLSPQLLQQLISHQQLFQHQVWFLDGAENHLSSSLE